MDKSLVRKALVNSGLLAASFLFSTCGDIVSGHLFVAMIGLIATAITAKDAYNFYKLT